MSKKDELRRKSALRKLQYAVRQKMKKCEMSKNEATHWAGNRIGYGQSYIKKLINGTSPMTTKTAIKVLRGLGKPPKKRYRLTVEVDKLEYEDLRTLTVGERRAALRKAWMIKSATKKEKLH